MKALLSRRLMISSTGTIVGILFFYPIRVVADFDRGAAWLDEFWPITRGDAS